ncbi:hypothetical protein CDAR_436561 [Caerostris darwini]|uniref:Uncharacterized protein n=1 Tax=Caerostris darwini TaxID=1538125 RepID=A0AAV4SBG2_9ARAC|nr:hypothetical protein CDAR_436561 [Caerostris darwini]
MSDWFLSLCPATAFDSNVARIYIHPCIHRPKHACATNSPRMGYARQLRFTTTVYSSNLTGKRNFNNNYTGPRNGGGDGVYGPPIKKRVCECVRNLFAWSHRKVTCTGGRGQVSPEKRSSTSDGRKTELHYNYMGGEQTRSDPKVSTGHDTHATNSAESGYVVLNQSPFLQAKLHRVPAD